MTSLFANEKLPSGPVECLGQTFTTDQARREHYQKLLADKLKDPEFRKIEGFPIGTDEDILAMSDPPYYTACPNPFLGDFIKQYGKPYDPTVPYSRELGCRNSPIMGPFLCLVLWIDRECLNCLQETIKKGYRKPMVGFPHYP